MSEPKKKILLVDDEPEIAEAFSVRLQASGYDVITANTGLEGLELAISEKPNMIISDILMPGMSGYDLVRELRSRGLLEKIPVMMFTAKGAEKDLCKVDGVREFLGKPINAEVLLEKIKKHLNGQCGQ